MEIDKITRKEIQPYRDLWKGYQKLSKNIIEIYKQHETGKNKTQLKRIPVI